MQCRPALTIVKDRPRSIRQPIPIDIDRPNRGRAERSPLKHGLRGHLRSTYENDVMSYSPPHGDWTKSTKKRPMTVSWIVTR